MIATLKVFWKKGFDVIISVHDFTNQILSCDENDIAAVNIRLSFGNYSISMREVIIISVL